MAENRGYAKFRWDGETHTANTMIGEDYTVDWEYQSPESLDIWIGGDQRAEAQVGDWIVRWAGGGFTVYAPDGKTVKSSTAKHKTSEPPVERKAAVEIGLGEGQWKEYQRRELPCLYERVQAVRWDGGEVHGGAILAGASSVGRVQCDRLILADGSLTHSVVPGSWIVRQADGRMYPMTDEIFRKWWEPVELKAAGTAEQCYRVIQANAPCDRDGDSKAGERLARRVSEAMAEGWKPTGGVAVQVANGHAAVWQAMWRPAGWKAWAEPVGIVPQAGNPPAPKAGPEFRPEEEGTIQPKPTGKAEVPKVAGFSSRGQPYVDLPAGGMTPNTTTISSDWFKTPESAGAVPPRYKVDPAEERRLIAWLSGLAKDQPGWVADWVYKTAVGAKPHATIHLMTDDVMKTSFTGYWMALQGTAETLFPWADLSVKPRRQVKPS